MDIGFSILVSYVVERRKKAKKTRMIWIVKWRLAFLKGVKVLIVVMGEGWRGRVVYRVHPPTQGRNVLVACGPGNNGISFSFRMLLIDMFVLNWKDWVVLWFAGQEAMALLLHGIFGIMGIALRSTIRKGVKMRFTRFTSAALNSMEKRQKKLKFSISALIHTTQKSEYSIYVWLWRVAEEH